jgi:hypothetical protein
MKTNRFLLTVIGSGVLTLGLGFAGQPPSQPSEQYPHEKHAASVHPAARRHGNTTATDQKHAHFNSGGQTSERSGLAGSWNTRSQNTPANPLHPPALKQAATAANAGLLRNRLGNHREAPGRLPAGKGTTAPLAGSVRGRGAAMAAIGGAAVSSAKNSAAAINGTGIKRKP